LEAALAPQVSQSDVAKSEAIEPSGQSSQVREEPTANFPGTQTKQRELPTEGLAYPGEHPVHEELAFPTE